MASIELQQVGVHYLIPQAKSAGLLNSVKALTLGGVIRRNQGRVGITALEDISLKLDDGDRIGLLGHNGAGKTTLLKVLAGILPPTSGRMRTEGHVSALMSIHIGLDQYATGYENIRIRARFMGLSDGEIEAHYDDIADFSELGDYLKLPIRAYSAGMRLRLAFSIVTAFSPDILILDEWLSAGDEKFQQKARERLTSLINRTGIFAFASHNEDLLKRLCNKTMVLEHGKPTYVGDVEGGIEFHKQLQATTPQIK